MRKRYTIIIQIFLLLISLISIMNPLTPISTQPVLAQQTYTYLFPLFLNHTLGLTSTSYYMITLDHTFIYNLGCQMGTRDKNMPGTQDSVVVLAFGCPQCFNSGIYSANLFGYGPVTTEQISNAIQQFALGYYSCTGSDNTSNLVIGAGTSNYLGGIYPCNTLGKSHSHGNAWSQMIQGLNQWAVNQGIFHQVQVYGANDIEVGWNTPKWSHTWISGFEQVSGNLMLHFGDAAGCPYDEKPNWSCGTAQYPEWTLEDVWYVAYGAPSALPLPLIYLTNGVHAKQWAYLSRYSVLQHGYRMDFTGVFTQWAACQQFPSDCFGIDNTPDMAYEQMIFELNKSPSTAQFIPWKTDIRWILESEISGSKLENLAEDSQFQFSKSWVENLNTALEEPKLSPTMRTSLESKKQAFQSIVALVALSSDKAATKQDFSTLIAQESPEISFYSGIIENGEILGLPYRANINQVWQTITD